MKKTQLPDKATWGMKLYVLKKISGLNRDRIEEMTGLTHFKQRNVEDGKAYYEDMDLYESVVIDYVNKNNS